MNEWMNELLLFRRKGLRDTLPKQRRADFHIVAYQPSRFVGQVIAVRYNFYVQYKRIVNTDLMTWPTDLNGALNTKVDFRCPHFNTLDTALLNISSATLPVTVKLNFGALTLTTDCQKVWCSFECVVLLNEFAPPCWSKKKKTELSKQTFYLSLKMDSTVVRPQNGEDLLQLLCYGCWFYDFCDGNESSTE